MYQIWSLEHKIFEAFQTARLEKGLVNHRSRKVMPRWRCKLMRENMK